MEVTRLRALIGEFVLALRERGFWTDGVGPAAETARTGQPEASAAGFCAWIEVTLLPHVAAALAATQRPEPVDGFAQAALAALGSDPDNAQLVRLAHELEQELRRSTAKTALDQALEQAESSAAAADAFYSLFANTRLLIPLAEGAAAMADDEFCPLTVTLDEVEYLPVFDSEARLREWSGEELPHTHLSGMALAVSLATSETLQVVLNPGSGCEKVFVPEELAALRGQLTQIDDTTWLCPPGNVSAEALALLSAGLALEPSVQSAHLAVRLAESESGAGVLLLALRCQPQADTAGATRFRALAASALQDLPFELLLTGEAPLADAVIAAVPAFYAVV